MLMAIAAAESGVDVALLPLIRLVLHTSLDRLHCNRALYTTEAFGDNLPLPVPLLLLVCDECDLLSSMLIAAAAAAAATVLAATALCVMSLCCQLSGGHCSV